MSIESLTQTLKSAAAAASKTARAGANRPERPIYLDYQATTPMDPRVLEAMLPYFIEKFGNPHSRSHAYGWEAEEAVEKARAQVASIIGADEREIIFTSGATESNNLALQGVAHFYKDKRNHIVTLAELERAVTDKTAIVSIMAVNNEIGVVQPLKEISRIVHAKGAFFHSDCAQAVGKIPLDVQAMGIDLMSISGHKIYGPKGIGALYVRRKPRVRLQALIHGGGQERGMRSGTLPTPLCVGLGEACAIAEREMADEAARLTKLRDRFYQAITARLPEVYLNGDLEQRVPGNLNISFAYVEGESLIMGIKGLSVSSGSACTSASLEPSYVLRALGVTEDLAHTSLRIGFGRFTSEADVDFAVEEITEHVEKLRAMSPLWEMVQEGIDIKSIKWAAH